MGLTPMIVAYSARSRLGTTLTLMNCAEAAMTTAAMP